MERRSEADLPTILALKRSRLRAVVTVLLRFDDHVGTNATTSTPDGFESRPAWFRDFVKIFEDLVGRRFEENTLIAEAVEIQLHRLELDANLVWRIAEDHCRVVWVPRHRAGRSELLLNVLDGVVTLWIWIWESLDVHDTKLKILD